MSELLDQIRKAFPPVDSPVPGLLSATVDMTAAEQVLQELDRGFEGAGRSDLLMAKASALCRMMQFKSAEELIDRVLAEDSRHLDAVQKKSFWDEWPLVFDYPEWTDSMTSVEGLYRSRLGPLEPSGVRIYLARCGITPVCVAVQSTEGLRFDHGIRPEMDSKLEIKIADTPHGPVGAYYVVLNDHPEDPFRREAFLNLSVVGVKDPFAGYWLLRRLAEQGDYFVVFVEGTKVLYNKRHRFNDRLSLNKLADEKPRMAPDQYMAAVQWFMNNVPMDGPAPSIEKPQENIPTFETTPFKDDRMVCDKDLCCGHPKVIERGQGYLFVSERVVEFRKDCPSIAQVREKFRKIVTDRLRNGGNPLELMNPDALWEEFVEQMDPVPMCEEGARAKKLNLEVAHADAVRWWKTGFAPLRATPRTEAVTDKPVFGETWPCGHKKDKGTSTCWKCRVPVKDRDKEDKGEGCGGCIILILLAAAAIAAYWFFTGDK